MRLGVGFYLNMGFNLDEYGKFQVVCNQSDQKETIHLEIGVKANWEKKEFMSDLVLEVMVIFLHLNVILC